MCVFVEVFDRCVIRMRKKFSGSIINLQKKNLDVSLSTLELVVRLLNKLEVFVLKVF